MSEEKIVCGVCKCDPDVIADDEGKPEIVCPICGARDYFEEAHRVVQQHIAEGIQRGLQDSMRQATRGNKTVKFEAQSIPRRTHKWITVAV